MFAHEPCAALPHRGLRRPACLLIFVLAAAILPNTGSAQSLPQQAVSTPCQSQDDAWWTGPLLTSTPDVLEQGHFYLEPYLFDSRTGRANSLQSVTDIDYGATPDLSVGITPSWNDQTAGGRPKIALGGAGDFSVQAEYQISRFDRDEAVPSVAIVLEESFPTGKYDRLGENPSNGSGAYTTSLGLFAQTYVWMPNGRILRGRINLVGSVSSEVGLKGTSAYGTPGNFHGRAFPGMSFGVWTGGEYSVTKQIVLALDLTWQHQDSNLLKGSLAPPRGDAFAARAISRHSGAADSFSIAPAIEYNFTSDVGIVLGVRVTPGSFAAPVSITPAAALSFYY